MIIGLLMPVGWSALKEFLPPKVDLPKPLEFNFGSKMAAELVRRGHEVHIFTLCHNFLGERNIEGSGLSIHIAGYRNPFRMCLIDGFRVEANRLKAMLHKHPCDVYNAHWQYEFARAAVEINAPHVITVRDNPWKVLWLFRPKLFRLMMLCLAYYTIAKAKHLSVASPYMANYLRKWHGVRGEIDVIPNAIPIETLPFGVRKTGEVVFVEIANGFSACKNVKTLLRAFALLQSMTATQCRLDLYGWGYGSGEECEMWAKKHNLARNVLFRGKMEQKEMLNQIGREADVFIHASKEESFGGVIVEAMGLGLPTIVGIKSGACAWVAGNGETGFLVDVRKPKEIAYAMKRMLEDENVRISFGENAFKRANSCFSIEGVTSQYLQMYTRVLKEESDAH